MIVFNNYFKILKKFLPLIIMYFVICIAVSVLVSNLDDNQAKSFQVSKPKVAIINNDNSVLAETLEKYIGETATIVKLKGKSEKDFQDGIFERAVDGIIEIPDGFGKEFQKNAQPKMVIRAVPDSYNAFYIQSLYDRFLNVADVYVKVGMNEKDIAAVIIKDLKSDTKVKVINKDKKTYSDVTYFYNYSNFGIVSILIYAVGIVAIAFKKKELQMRNYVSGYTAAKINRERFLGNLTLGFGTCIVFVIASIIMYGKAMLNKQGALLMLNTLVFCAVILCFAFLLSSIVKKKEAVSGMMNIFALGSSFLCGAFIPQEFLGASTLTIGKVFPSYWFISNNNKIEALNSFSMDSLESIFINMAVMIGFGIIFMVVQFLLVRREELRGVK